MKKTFQLTPRTLTLAVSSAVIAMSLSSTAQAQESGRLVLEEIIVTSQKRVENLQDTPIAISAFGSDELERRQVVNTRDLMGSVASLNGMESSPGRGNLSLSMRGISGGNPQSLSTDPAVAVYFDGIFLGKQTASTMDVADIERIEVLRGPQGTLYGRNATAGAINFITRKPSGEFQLKGSASVGNENMRSAKLNVDLPALGNSDEGIGSLSTSLGYSIRARDEFYGNTNPNLGGFEDLDRQAFRFAARWQLGDDFTADYVYSMGKLNERGPLAKTVAQVPQDASGTTYADVLKGMRAGGFFLGNGQRVQDSVDATIAQLDAIDAGGDSRPSNGSTDVESSVISESQSHSLSLNWEAGDWGVLGDVSFASITGFSKIDNTNIGDIDGFDSSLDANGVGALNPLTLQTYLSAFPEPALNFLVDQYGGGHYDLQMIMNYESLSQELQMVGSTDTVDYVFGLYYYEDEGDSRNLQYPIQPVAGASRVDYENSTQAEAFFTQATYRPIDPLAITVGARYSKETKDVLYLYQSASAFVPGYDGVTTSPTPGEYGNKFDENYYNASGMLNVAYDVSSEIMVYATVSNGFHSGFFNGDSYPTGQADGNPIEEEIITNYELGVKSSWFDSRLQANASLFRYEFDDIQVSQTAIINGNLASFYVNAGSATRDGFELDIKALPVEDLVLSLSYAYLDGTYDEYPDHCGLVSGVAQCITNMEDFAQRARTPDHAVRFFADYVFARTDFAEFNGLLGVDWQEEAAASAVWTGSYTDGTPIVSPNIMNDERTLVSLRLAAENIEVGGGQMTVSLSGKNLLDDDYSTMGINFGRQVGLVTQNYGSPRTYMLEVSYQY